MTHTTAALQVPGGLHLARQGDDGDTWRVVHTASGKHIPLIDWPAAGVPHRYAQVAAASLAVSGVDWTRSTSDLVHDPRNLRHVADAARAASTAAYDAAVHAGDRADDRPRPHDLATRQQVSAARRHDLAAPKGHRHA